MVEGIQLLNLIQDVYLNEDITIASCARMRSLVSLAG
jgi:hypothetical protein